MLKIDGFASLLLRANALANGTSGARVGLVEAVLACLNGDVLPQVPSRGSVGASGDLAPLAQARPSASGRAGRGSTDVEVRRCRTPGGTATRSAGLTPLQRVNNLCGTNS